MSTDRKIFKGFVGGIGLSLATISVSFLQLRILLHYLPQSMVGVWLLYTSMGAYVSFLDLGLTPTLGREISFASGRLDIDDGERQRRVATLIRSCTRVVSFLSVGIYLIAAVAGWWYLRTVTLPAEQGKLHFAWLVFAAGAVLSLVGEGWFAGIYGLGDIFTEKLIRSCGVLFGFAMMVVTVTLGFGIRGLALSWFAQTVLTLFAARYVLRKSHPGLRSLGAVDYRLIRDLAGPSLKYALTVLGGILILQTDNLVIASTLGTHVIPDYQAIAKIVTVLMTLSMTLVVTSSPFISRAHAQEDVGEIRRLLERNQRFSLSVLIIAGSCLACFADRIVHLWLGANHFIGFGVVWVLLAIMCLEAHHLAMATATMATGRMVFVAPALIAGVLNIVFSVALAHRLGVLGVALGTLFAQVLTNNWYVPRYTMQQLHISLTHQMRRVILPMLTLLAITCGIGAGMRAATRTTPDAVAVLGGCVAAGGSGFALFYFWILSAEERQIIARKLKRMAPGEGVLASR